MCNAKGAKVASGSAGSAGPALYSGSRMEEQAIGRHWNVAPRHLMRREPRRRGRLVRNAALAASLLNALVVMSLIMLIATMAPRSFPLANVSVYASTGGSSGPAHQEPDEQKSAVVEDNPDSEPLSTLEEVVLGKLLSRIRVPERPSQPHPAEDTRAAATAHPSTAGSVILQKRPPTGTEYSEPLVQAPAPAAEKQQHGGQAQDTSNRSDVGVPVIQLGEAVSETANLASVEPESPETAATEPSGDGEVIAESNSQPAESPPVGLARDQTGGATAFADQGGSDGQSPVDEIAAAEPDIASAGAATTPDVTRSASVRVAVNMRAEPRLDATIITVLPASTEVGVISCDGWCEVVFADKRGWIYGSLVSDGLGNNNSGGVARSSVADVGGSGGAGTASIEVGDSRGSEDAPNRYTSAAAVSAGGTAAATNLSLAAGTPLISADGAWIGVIRDLTSDPTGQIFLVVDVKEELRTALPSIRIRIEHVLAAEPYPRLKFTHAQFVNELPTATGR